MINSADFALAAERFLWMLVLDGEREAGMADPASTVRGAAVARVTYLNEQLEHADEALLTDAMMTNSPERDRAFRSAFRQMSASLELLANSVGLVR